MKKRRPDPLWESQFIRAIWELIQGLEEYHGEKFTQEDFDLIADVMRATRKEDYSRERFALMIEEVFCLNHGTEPVLDPKWFMN